MRRPVSRFLLAILTAAAFAACRQYMPTGRYLQLRARPNPHTTADARRKFDHERHRRSLSASGVTCLECHRFDVKILAPEEPLARELSAHAQYPGSAACHFCHLPGDGQMLGAPTDCISCHDNLAALRPQDHDLSWQRTHAQMARLDPARCESCHRQAQCIDCHQRRDGIQMRVHDRNFRFFHGIQAVASPMQCGSCHRQDFCSRCHERGALEGQ